MWERFELPQQQLQLHKLQRAAVPSTGAARGAALSATASCQEWRRMKEES